MALEIERAGRELRDRHQQPVKRLCDADIDFVIVGGFAAMLYGSSLLTRHLDVCASLIRANVASSAKS
jgi:hypothetical protein